MKVRDSAAAAASPSALCAVGSDRSDSAPAVEARIGSTGRGAPFKLRYAPHPGQFRHLAGHNYCDQIRFAADAGFTAWEDLGMMGRPGRLQEQAAEVMREEGITMGAFAGFMSFNNSTFANLDAGGWHILGGRMRQVVECAKRVNAKWTSVVPGTRANQLGWNRQTRNVIETLKRCVEILEPEGVVMVLEPLDATSHPACFLTGLEQAQRICEAVNSPSCKILADLYHHHVADRDLISLLDLTWDQLAYVQVGDHPGRTEPGTGEIDFPSVFKHLHRKGFQGVVGMEHGNSRRGKEGEIGLIQAYRDAENC